MLQLPNASSGSLFRLASSMAGAVPDITLDGFPEYATGPESLAADQRAAFSRLVQSIDRSQYTMRPIVGAVVFGHADKALRKAPGERPAFELEVSRNRADSAAAYLVAELKREAHGAHYAVTFPCIPLGLGNSRPVFPNAANEQQMRRNRRVEIVLVERALTPPRCISF